MATTTTAKASHSARTKAICVVPDGTVTVPEKWHEGFLVFESGCLKSGSDRGAILCDEQYQAADRLLADGYVLGVVANPYEAVAVTREIVEQCNTPIDAVFDEDDAMVYFAKRKLPSTKRTK